MPNGGSYGGGLSVGTGGKCSSGGPLSLFISWIFEGTKQCLTLVVLKEEAVIELGLLLLSM